MVLIDFNKWNIFFQILGGQCLTTNSDDSPVKNAPCVFPFKYNGKTHNSCTMDGESKLWCSTKVDQNGQYLKNQWGFCGEDCENKGEQDEQESQKQTSK